MRSAAADPSRDIFPGARDAFVAAADAFGVPARVDRLRVDILVADPATARAAAPDRRRRVFARLGGVVGVDGDPLGGVAYGDSFVVDAERRTTVLTSCVPLSAACPRRASSRRSTGADAPPRRPRRRRGARYAETMTRRTGKAARRWEDERRHPPWRGRDGDESGGRARRGMDQPAGGGCRRGRRGTHRRRAGDVRGRGRRRRRAEAREATPSRRYEGRRAEGTRRRRAEGTRRRPRALSLTTKTK